MADPTPDLRQWRYFVTVADERHFGRAAERLSMTQPPLSQAIRALEDALGVALFARTKRSVALTAVGAALLPDVRRLLAADALPPLARRLARGEAGSLSLAFVSTADYGLLPALLRAFGARYPQVRLQLTEATSDVQIDELVAGASTRRHSARAAAPRGRAVVPAHARAAGGGDAGRGEQCAGRRRASRRGCRVAARDLSASSGARLYDIITGCYGAAGQRRTSEEAIQMQTIVSLVSAGMGVALVPQSLRNLRRTGVVYRPLADHAPVVETGLVWRTGDVARAGRLHRRRARAGPRHVT